MYDRIIPRIIEMGANPDVSIEELDQFVDECISFLIREQENTPGLDLMNDIFDIEGARQDALVTKYSFYGAI